MGALHADRRAALVRRVGPGRLERRYQERVSELGLEAREQTERARSLEARLASTGAAFELSQRVERACQRRLDRLEDRLDRREEDLDRAHQAHKRLALGLGALQRENELLRRRVELAAAEPLRVSGDRLRRGPWWRRWTEPSTRRRSGSRA